MNIKYDSIGPFESISRGGIYSEVEVTARVETRCALKTSLYDCLFIKPVGSQAVVSIKMEDKRERQNDHKENKDRHPREAYHGTRPVCRASRPD